MEKEELKNKLEEIVAADLSNLANYGFNDEQKKLGSAIVFKELQYLQDDKKSVEESKLKLREIEEKTLLEKEKLALEREKIEIEKTKLSHETRKLDQEQAAQIYKVSQDKKENRIRIILAAIGATGSILTAIGTITGKVLYYKLTKIAQTYDYEQFKIESGSSRENRNKLDK